eukprot:TRINITY_DN826_c0_g1_i4.p1 TRINITY_DN826_c0_g1~~TRINITY_DN826_c0_g1_i4.p1  ORF type:complete len:187 (+),score=15.11 TRINITY_DN826_c0_g1_i4:109-669(+)
MFLGITYEAVKRFQKDGFVSLYCGQLHNPNDSPIYYWLYIYYLSKFYELFDTWIILLKKKNLIFLHVYHHAIVIAMVWLWIDRRLVYTWVGMQFNTAIHVLMYYYYACSSLGIEIWWKKYITQIQIIQFISSFILSFPYIYYSYSMECEGWSAFMFSLFVNSSFLFLFVQFFKSTYTNKKIPSKKE